MKKINFVILPINNISSYIRIKLDLYNIAHLKIIIYEMKNINYKN